MAKQLAISASGVQGVGHRISGCTSQPLMPPRLVSIHPVSKTDGQRNGGRHPPESSFGGMPRAGFATLTGWLCLAGLVLLLTGTGRLAGVINDPARQTDPARQPV